MRSVETSAKKREDAIDQALKELGAERHEVQVEILDEGSPGLFGFGARDVKVRVSLEGAPDDEPMEEDLSPEPSPNRKPRRRSGGQRRRESKPARNAAPKRDEDRSRKSDSKPARDDRNRRKTEEEAAPAAPSQKEEPAPKPRKPRPKPVPPTEEELVRGKEAAALLQETIKCMGIDAAVSSGPCEEGGVKLSVESEDSALLIGRKGRNLDAMQYLINRMASRPENASEEGERITVDVEGYLERRRESLVEMAQQMAVRALDTGRRVRMKPLSPQERRIIHLALEDNPEIRTFSVGSSSLRSVIIAPANGTDAEEDRPRRSRRGGHNRNSGRRPQRQRGGSRQSRTGDGEGESAAYSGGSRGEADAS